MSPNLKKLLLTAVLVIPLVGIAAYTTFQLANNYKDVSPLKALTQVINDVPKEVQNSGKFTATTDQESQSSFLTVDGVIKHTNEARAKNGLPPLAVNSKLNLSALRKAQDMFARQYFEHDSPTGEGVGDLAEKAGYAYILVGENLALGNFENDQVLVDGWMGSPGHRANILNTKYTQIGVSVLKGTYEGRQTWMAVQHFGKPLSDCSSPSNNLKSQIESNNVKLSALEAEISAMKKDLDQTPRSDPSYNQKVEAYNAKVNEYNTLLEQTKGMINDYNLQVESFNKCASS